MKSINLVSNKLLTKYLDWNSFDPKHNHELVKSKYYYKNVKPGGEVLYYDRDLWTEDNYWTNNI